MLASVTALLVASCGRNSSQPTYDAAIQEGQTAAQDLINQGVSAVMIGLVNDKRKSVQPGHACRSSLPTSRPTCCVRSMDTPQVRPPCLHSAEIISSDLTIRIAALEDRVLNIETRRPPQ